MSALIRWIAVGSLALLAVPVAAQAKYAPSPEKYDVHIRYRIRTDRDERIRQFQAMQAYLKELGYVPVRRLDDDLDIFNPDAENTNGTIPAAGVEKLLKQPSIVTVVLVPAGSQLLAVPTASTQVRIKIRGGFPLDEQRRLHEQIVARLGKLGFQEAVGYDHSKFEIVRGAMPAGQVLSLLKDLRTLPAGYFFGPVGSVEVPAPFANVVPVRSVEVLPALPASTVTAFDPGLLTADLAAAVASSADRPLMIEAIFDPAVLTTASLRGRVRSAALEATLNGVIGPVAIIRVPNGAAVANIAKIPGLVRLRLPRLANETVRVVPQAVSPGFVAASHTDELHKRGYTGTGTKVVVIGSSFEGWEKRVGKELPQGVRYLDLTAETDTAVQPLPVDAERISGGLPAAVAASQAAPGAELHLVRIDPAQRHQLLTVLRAVSGDTSLSVAQFARVEEASVKTVQLRAARQLANEQYRKAFDNLSDEPEAKQAREAALAATKVRQQEEAVFTNIVARYTALRAGVEALKNAEIVANTLVWEVGAPHDGLNEIGRDLETKLYARAGLTALQAAKLPPPTGWVQAAGLSTGQVWAGPWMDRDGNGVLEFDATNAGLPQGRWTKELNFLRYGTHGAAPTSTLPAGVKLRISAQWREPHDPNGYPPEGAIFPMRLRVLQQADPTGQTHATDDLIEVARAQGDPTRLARTRGSQTFTHSVDVTLPAAGVYALRVEGSPDFAGLALGLTRNLEPRIRLFVELLDAGERAKGQVTFGTYSDDAGGVGVPGDSVAALTVGTADAKGPTSLTGLGPGVTLGVKPDVTVNTTVTVDGKTYGGTAIATGYTSGLCACLSELGVRPVGLVRALGLTPGGSLALPPAWLAKVPAKPDRARDR